MSSSYRVGRFLFEQFRLPDDYAGTNIFFPFSRRVLKKKLLSGDRFGMVIGGSGIRSFKKKRPTR